MLDRTKRPNYKSPQPVHISKPLYYSPSFLGIPDNSVDVCRIELLFPAGAYYNRKKGTSSLISNLFLEGTSELTSQQISEKFAFWGSFIDFSSTAEYLKVSLYSLTKYLNESIELLIHVLKDSSFSEDAINRKKTILKNKITIQKEKTSFEASMVFKDLLFNNTPYAHTTLEEDINNIERSDIIEFYQNQIEEKCISIFINGSYNPNNIEQINTSFNPRIENLKTEKFNIQHTTTDFIKDKKEAIQSSIRIGCITENRLSKDYPKNILLNELFGGYFGSRLMKNIREDKGYTYGIHSRISHFQNVSFFNIGTDVKKENSDDTFLEIKQEIEILKSTPVSDEELFTVKNYIIGSFISSLNNSFDLLDKWKTIHLNKLPQDYYSDLQKSILDVSSEEIQNQANSFFTNYNEFIKVSIG